MSLDRFAQHPSEPHLLLPPAGVVEVTHEVVSTGEVKLSMSNANKIFTIVAFLVSVAASYGFNQATLHYRLEDLHGQIAQSVKDAERMIEANRERITKVEALVDYMRLHGHDDHERRIAKVENQNFGELSSAVRQQTVQMELLTALVAKTVEAQSRDHDVLVRMVTLYESRGKGS